MNNNGQTRFQKRLDSILKSEENMDDILESLDGEEEEERTQLPITVEFEDVPSELNSEEENIPADLAADYHYVRKMLYGVMGRGSAALEGALIIARESEHPRAYEVASSIMKNLSDVSKDLIGLHDNVHGKSSSNSGSVGKQYNQQNNFYGTNEGDGKNVNEMLDDLEDDEEKE